MRPPLIPDGSSLHYSSEILVVGGVMDLELIKSIKSLWNIEQSIEVTLADGTKVRVSSERDVDLALKTIRKLKDGLLDTPKNP